MLTSLPATASPCSTSSRCQPAVTHNRSHRGLRPHGSACAHPRRAARLGAVGRVAATGGGGEGFFESEVVQEESSKIMRDYEGMMKLLPKFANFDLDGKRIFLDKMDELCERLKIFNFRAKNSSDPSVAEFLANLSRQLLFMNTNLDSIYEGMRQQSQELRQIVDRESKIVDPQELATFRAGLARQMGATSAVQDALARNLSVDKMMEDPSVMKTMMSNPKALVAIRDVVEGGLSAVEKYRSEPELYRVLCKVFELPASGT